MLKENLRLALLAQRNAITDDVRAQHDAALYDNLIAWWNRHPVRCLGVYWPIRGEPDLQTMYAELAKRGVQLALPVVTNANAPLQFARWAPGDALVPGPLKVPVPPQPQTFVFPEAVLIPCVGFNRQCFRLGYGGGLYDRTLALTPRPLAIGVAYSCGLATFVAAPHDIALDTIVTECTNFVETNQTPC
jgi:5-formyltetrahydrofolate cyclo-ligase